MELPRGTTNILKRRWEGIDAAISPLLREVASLGQNVLKSDRYLRGVDPVHDMYGCGFWGCAYPTLARGWTLKVTADPLEGPMTYAVMSDTMLREHVGVAFVLGVWRLREVSDEGYTIYVILREDITPVKKIGEDLEIEMHEVRGESASLNEAISNIENYGDTPDLLLAKDEQERMWIESLHQLNSRFETKQIADFMLKFYGRFGGALSDIHHQNVGRRTHSLEYLDLWGHVPSQFFVIFDIGHSVVKVPGEVPVIKNPGRIPVI